MTHDEEEQILRDWLVEEGHIKPEDRDTIGIKFCRPNEYAVDTKPALQVVREDA